MMHTQDLFPINEFGRPGRGFGRALTPALLALLALPAAAAPSLLLSEPPGWNGWTVSGTVKAGYREHGGAREALTTASQTRTITPFGATPGEVIALAPLSASRLPTSGAAKDKAEGSLGFTYRVGGGAVPDTFTIDLNATTSAMTAYYNFGDGTPVPADAYFEATLVLETYAPLAGAVLRLPDMPIPAAAAPSTESLVAQITAGPTLGFFLPGHAGIDYPLTLAPAPGAPYFRYELTYSVTTPFGADPEVAYRLTGGASAAPAPPAPPLTAAEDSVRREMPKVRLNKLVYDSDDPISATVVAQQAADFAAHNTLVLVCPETGDIEKITLAATGDPLRQAGAGVQLKTGGGINPFDGVLVVPPGRPFSALYSYTLSQRITEDLQAGLKKSEKLVSADFGLAFDPAPPGVSVQVTPPIAIGGTAEENPPPGAKRTGTLAVEGMPGIVQIASDELIVAPLDAAHAAEFAARAGATYAENDAEWRGPNATPVWHRAVMADTAQAEAARQARVRYLPQLLALAGRTGHLHASNQRVLGLFATGLELWLEGFPCAVNPKAYPDGQLRAPEGRDFSRVASGGLPNPFDSMTSPQPHYDDPLQNLRDLWAEVAMHDLDGEVVQVAFIDSAFAPNPDFRGYPDAIPQFDMETGERGPHVAEKPEQPVFVRTPVWHGNGTVAVAGAVMGNRYGVAGVAGQIMQPMLYYMGTKSFAFEMGRAMELAVADGADVINISASYPCRLLTVLGPIRICSEDDRRNIAAFAAALVAASNAAVCALGAGLDVFLPGAGAALCAASGTAAATAIAALFDSLFINSLIGDPRQPMERGVAVAKAAGVPVVASAGNRINWSFMGEFQALFDTANSRADDWETVPAVIPDVICVGATSNPPGVVTPGAPYPNSQMHGPAVDLWAPEGQPAMLPHDQQSADPANVAPDAQGLIDFFGTSASAPFVSGIIAQMMAVNPTLDPRRANAGQRATLVDRLRALLVSSATVPGSVPEVPATSATDPDVARRGLLVHAYRAWAAARDNAGVPALGSGGFNARFARFDDEAGDRLTDDEVVVSLGASGTGPGMTPLFGGLPFGDMDRYYFRLSQAGSVVPRATLNIYVPNHCAPPPFLLNHGRPVPRVAVGPTETRYDIALRGCPWFDIQLSAGRSFPADPSPLRRPDVLYRLEITGHVSDPVAVRDSYETAGGGTNNNDPDTATNLAGSGWVAASGPFTPFRSDQSKTRTVTGVTLHGCEDVDWFRIQPWDGYDGGALDWARWVTLVATLDPPTPGVRLQFHEEVADGASTRVEPVSRPGDGGGIGAEINLDAHPLPLLLRVDGHTTANFSIRLTACVPGAGLTGAASGAASRRGEGGFQMWQQLREARLVRFADVLGLGASLRFPPDLCEECWFRDSQGRAITGQLLIMNHTGGPLRATAIPGGPGASLRMDFTDALTGQALGGVATADLFDYDGDQPGLEYRPQSAPMTLEIKDAPPGEYLLAVSGFKLSDTWLLVPGASSALPGGATAEMIMAGTGVGPNGFFGGTWPAPPVAGSAFEALNGAPFKLYPVDGWRLAFKIPDDRHWQLEYSADGGENWTPTGPVYQGPAEVDAFPPAGGLARVRTIWPREVVAISGSMPLRSFAVPTEPGRSYGMETSQDLESFMLFSAPRPGDGSVLRFDIPQMGDRNFMRVRRF